MSSTNIEKLLSSLAALIDAINNAERLLIQKGETDSHTYTRILKYKEICAQQLDLASNAADALNRKDHERAEKSINLINHLAEFVKEDAQDILGVEYITFSSRPVV